MNQKEQKELELFKNYSKNDLYPINGIKEKDKKKEKN